MARTTRATQALTAAGAAFTLHVYGYDPSAARIGLQAAEALGEDPGCVFKTQMAVVDGRPVCVAIPSDAEVSMKALAAAFGGKAAAMMAPADAERLTGYVIGGVSPFGHKKRVPTLIEQAALARPFIYLNGGQRGLQIRIAPAEVLRVLEARSAPLTA